jgi:hypothetical protein
MKGEELRSKPFCGVEEAGTILDHVASAVDGGCDDGCFGVPASFFDKVLGGNEKFGLVEEDVDMVQGLGGRGDKAHDSLWFFGELEGVVEKLVVDGSGHGGSFKWGSFKC